jgi:hypothetical protein
MKQTLLFIFIFFVSIQQNFSQKLVLSDQSEISIITAGPGDVLYEVFGHSAIRVKDPTLNLDIIFNYGLFDFNQPNFYVNFVKGRLLYRLGKQSFRRFITSYDYQQRWVKDQVLNLSLVDRKKIFEYLNKNSLPENAEYLYDPYFNNCATKLRDIAKEILGNKIQFPSSFSDENFTLRQLMNQELPWNTWGSFGINLALGNTLDKEIIADNYMYLPDYVHNAFQNASITENKTITPLVLKESQLLRYPEKQIDIQWYNPFSVFSLLLLLTILVTFRDQKRNIRSKWLDFTLFFGTGVLGIIICFLWFFTDHYTAPNNFNLLWAFVLNFFVAFILLKSRIPSWTSKYLLFYLFLLFGAIITSFIGLQQFSNAVFPIMAMLFLRTFYIYRLLTFKK